MITTEKIDPNMLNLKDKVVYINRVAKVVKGGRRFSFSALVVVGNGEGIVGIGKGKALEVPESIRKAVEQAKKSLIKFPMQKTTIPYRIIGKFSSNSVIMNPAPKGTGIIAGSGVRSIFEVAGIQDIVAKALGGHNPFNSVKAALNGLRNIKKPESVLKLREKSEKDIPTSEESKIEPIKSIQAKASEENLGSI